MDRDTSRVVELRTLLALPDERGALFDDEMARTRRRIDAVHRAAVSHNTEPAGAPRLQPRDA
ncbi:MAG TPA: hypothetical protein VK587_08275 [bacterium]|nr:hypothetical protein [bacterium]